VDRVGASIRLDDEADVDRDVERARKDRAIAADLLGEHLAPLGPEVALDEQDDGAVGDPDPGQGIRSQEAVEQLPAGSLGNPGEDALPEQPIPMPQERGEQVVRRELMDGGRALSFVSSAS